MVLVDSRNKKGKSLKVVKIPSETQSPNMNSVGCQAGMVLGLQNESMSSRSLQLSQTGGATFKLPSRGDLNVAHGAGVNSVLYHEVFGVLAPFHSERMELLEDGRDDLLGEARRRRRGKEYNCLQCGRNFSRREHLTNHLATHETKPPHRCEPCGKVFSRQEHWKSHMARHSRPYECEGCGKGFGRREHLSRHQSGGCPEGGTRSGLSCHLCGKVFTRREHYVNHVKWHSGESPHVCLVCHKAFTRKEHLRNHVRTHTGESPHQCKFCGRLFSRREHLVNHTRQHTGETPFRCDMCPKAFSRKDHLLNHTRLHSREHFMAIEPQVSLENQPSQKNSPPPPPPH